MAKQKTKAIPFDNKATEVVPGVWEWDIGGQKWSWSSGMGINVTMIHEGVGVGLVYVPKIEAAAYYAEGYSMGLANGLAAVKRQGATQVSGAETPAAGRERVRVTHQQMYLFLDHGGKSVDYTFDQWEDENKGNDDPDIVGFDLFNALKRCTIEDVVVSKSMSENHLGGDDVLWFVELTLKAVEKGLKIECWYGDSTEVLVVGYDPNEIEFVEAPYVGDVGEDGDPVWVNEDDED